MEEIVSKAVLKTSRKRCEIKSTVYNFSTKVIDDEMVSTLNLGGNYILHNDEMDEEEAQAKLENELLNYAVRYRRYIQKMPTIEMSYLEEWLKEAIRISNDDEHKEFYEALTDYKNVKLSRRRFTIDENQNFRKLDEEGITII